MTHQALGHVSAHEIINAEGILHALSALVTFLHLHVSGMKNINSTVHERRLTAWKRVTNLQESKSVVYNKINGNEECETCSC